MGLALAVLVAFVEFLVYARRRHLQRGAFSLCALAVSEFALAAKCLRRSQRRSRGPSDTATTKGPKWPEDDLNAGPTGHISFRRFADGVDEIIDERERAGDGAAYDLPTLETAATEAASQLVYAVPPPPPPPAPEKLARLFSILNHIHPHP